MCPGRTGTQFSRATIVSAAARETFRRESVCACLYPRRTSRGPLGPAVKPAVKTGCWGLAPAGGLAAACSTVAVSASRQSRCPTGQKRCQPRSRCSQDGRETCRTHCQRVPAARCVQETGTELTCEQLMDTSSTGHGRGAGASACTSACRPTQPEPTTWLPAEDADSQANRVCRAPCGSWLLGAGALALARSPLYVWGARRLTCSGQQKKRLHWQKRARAAVGTETGATTEAFSPEESASNVGGPVAFEALHGGEASKPTSGKWLGYVRCGQQVRVRQTQLSSPNWNVPSQAGKSWAR